MSPRTYGVTADGCNNRLFKLSDNFPISEEVGGVRFGDFGKVCQKGFSKVLEIFTGLVLHFLDVRTSCAQTSLIEFMIRLTEKHTRKRAL